VLEWRDRLVCSHAGEADDGQRVPTLADLARSYHVSKSTISRLRTD